MEESCLRSCSPGLAQFILLHNPGLPAQGVVPPNMALPQPLINKMLYSRAHRPGWWGECFNVHSLLQNDSSFCQVDKNNQGGGESLLI